MGLGSKMCKYKVVECRYTGYYGSPPIKPGQYGYSNETIIRCKNPNVSAKEIMKADSKMCCRRLCPYYESR